ncbi:MAG: MerR family DNA-binding transcriptional regulator [Rhizorhabdus sp.]|uniref:MerR family transcriptional regulator n=1 Tax=Rhizorhabdus sp. TaxID=1968843 RepID=UPI001B5CC2AF|nr:MerR family DNA-binding transcriptional regulator [Rhizorhabdus sp.]MBP8234145.1 MerR family DNA-binding transcriptional regulator [Rhizorhabdus sp.]
MASNPVPAVRDTDAHVPDSYTISEMARAFEITPRALRFYEEEGLIAPRREGAARIYSRRDWRRVSLILRGKAVGFSLDEIGELLDLYDPRDNGAAQRQAAKRYCELKEDELQRQREAIETKMAELRSFAVKLDGKCN